MPALFGECVSFCTESATEILPDILVLSIIVSLVMTVDVSYGLPLTSWALILDRAANEINMNVIYRCNAMEDYSNILKNSSRLFLELKGMVMTPLPFLPSCILGLSPVLSSKFWRKLAILTGSTCGDFVDFFALRKHL